MTGRAYLYPAWLRAWHWSNAALFIALVASGVSLHYADPTFPWIPFRVARLIHNVAGIALAVLYVGYIVASLLSGNWRQYATDKGRLVEGVRMQARYYLVGVFRGEQHPFEVTRERKFNPLQRVAYVGVMAIALPMLIGTGLALLFPAAAPARVLGAGGVWPMAVAHSAVAFFLTLFLVGHVYLATMGATPLANVRSMVTGWHESHEGPR